MNKDLKDEVFEVPDDVIRRIKAAVAKSDDGSTAGYKRANDLINNRRVSYAQIKRIKNYFDNYDGNGADIEYGLNGGDVMKKWVNKQLGDARKEVHNDKKRAKDAGVENAFIRNHEKDRMNSNPTNVNLPENYKSEVSFVNEYFNRMSKF